MPSNRNLRRIVLCGIAVLLIAQQVLSVSGQSPLDKALNNAFHLPWFFAVTLGLRVWIGAWPRALMAACALSLASEGVQYLTGREASITDLLRNAAGTATAWLLWQITVTSLRSRRWFYGSLAVLITTATLSPLAAALASKQYMDSRFPLLLDMSDPRGHAHARATSRASASPDGLQLAIDGSPWPGVHISDPIADWSGYRTLNIDVTLDSGTPIDLFVGLLLKPGDGITDFNITGLEPGRQQVAFALEALLPQGDAPVHDVFLYTTGAYTGRRLTFHSVWLD